MVGRKIADEFILVPIRQNVSDLQYMYNLNALGTYIWELLDDYKTIPELVNMISTDYEIDPRQIEEDVTEFLGQLLEIGAVKETILVGE